MKTSGRGAKPSPSTLKIRAYLESLSPQELNEIDADKYRLKTGHKDFLKHNFFSERRRMWKQKGDGRRVKTPMGNVFQILGTFPVDDRSDIANMRKMVLEIVRSTHPNHEDVQAVVLTEPRVMEVRVPYR
jgi:hypothetical protein